MTLKGVGRCCIIHDTLGSSILLFILVGLGNIGLLIWTSIFWLVLLTAVRATCYPRLIKRTLMILGIIIVAISIVGVF